MIRADTTDDIISGTDIAQAAETVIRSCVQGSPNQGGVRGFLGFGKSLAVRVVSYAPAVHCADEPGKRGPPKGSCRGVLDYMRASYDRQIFGRIGTKGVEVNLPQSFLDCWSSLW